MKKLATILILCILLTGCAKSSPTINNKVLAAVNTSNSNNVSYYFARQTPNVDQQLIKVIDSSKSTLDIAIYSLTKQSIVDSIISAKNRGVNVRVMSDKVESKSKSESKELVLLKNAKIPVKINSHAGLLHIKMTVADKNVATTGSYNYTQAATTENDEVLVIINDSKVATDFDNEFETMWNDNKDYKDF